MVVLEWVASKQELMKAQPSILERVVLMFHPK
jgi:hypothetical protein